jgi:hypothetical protein
MNHFKTFGSFLNESKIFEGPVTEVKIDNKAALKEANNWCTASSFNKIKNEKRFFEILEYISKVSVKEISNVVKDLWASEERYTKENSIEGYNEEAKNVYEQLAKPLSSGKFTDDTVFLAYGPIAWLFLIMESRYDVTVENNYFPKYKK